MSFLGLPGSDRANEGDPDLDSTLLGLQGLSWEFDPNDPLLFDWDVQASPAPPPTTVDGTLPCATRNPLACEASSIPATKKIAKRKTPKDSKDRISELVQRVERLQHEVDRAQHRREELLSQENKLQSPANCPGEAGPGLDGLSDPNNMYWLLDADGQVQHRKGTELVNLTSEESLAIHQVYMDVLGHMLEHRQDSSKDAEIVKLAEQFCRSVMLKALFRPAGMRRIINFDGEHLDAAGKQQVARQALAALNLSGEQRDRMLQQRRSYLAKQGQLLQSRQQLLATLQENQTRPCSCDREVVKQASTCQQLMQDLRVNLQKDQLALICLFSQVFGYTLCGIQPAIILTQFWPSPFDLVALLNELAAEASDVDAQALLGSSAPST